MKISDIFKQTTIRPASGEQTSKAEERDKEAKVLAAKERGEDTVSISEASKHLAQVSSILADDEKASAAKVADIKARIADGTYDITSEAVARAILGYNDDN